MVPTIEKVEVYPVAGYDSMLLNLSGAHGPYFTRNVVILTDSEGVEGISEVLAPQDHRGPKRDRQPGRGPAHRPVQKHRPLHPRQVRRPRCGWPRRPDLRSAHDRARPDRHRDRAARHPGQAPERAGGLPSGRRPGPRLRALPRLSVLCGRPQQDRPALHPRRRRFRRLGPHPPRRGPHARGHRRARQGRL